MTPKLKPLVLAALASLSMLSASAHAQSCAPLGSPFSLSEAVSQALCANPEMRGYRLDASASAANVDVARAAYLPTITANVSGTRQSTGTEAGSQRGIALNWLLYDFGGREARVAAATATHSAAEAVAENRAQDLALQVAQAYFQVQAAGAATDAAISQERAADKAMQLAKARHKAGLGVALEVLQAQSALAQATVARTRAQGQAQVQKAMLAKLIGVPAQDSTTLRVREVSAGEHQDAAPPAGLNELVQEARKNRMDIVAQRAKADSLASQAQAARAAHLPSIGLNAGINRANSVYGDTSSAKTIGLTISIPLYSGGATSAQVRSLDAQAEAQRERVAASENEAGYDVVAAHETLVSAQAQLEAALTLAESASLAVEQATARYQAGVGTMLEVLDSLSKSASSDETFISSLLSSRLARAQLARSLGQMPVN